MTTWRTRIACWITEAANTLSAYVIFIAFPLQKWLYESASTLRYTYVASPVILCIVNYILCTKFFKKYNFFDIKEGRSEKDFMSYKCGLYKKKFSINLLLSYCFSTYALLQMRHLSYRRTNFSIPCWLKSTSSVASHPFMTVFTSKLSLWPPKLCYCAENRW